jgi:hypothetical protein
MPAKGIRPWEREGAEDVKDQRSRIRWTNPAHRELVLKAAKEHGFRDSEFLETLVLAWFDPFHFSRMLRWLYPDGHAAFEAPAARGGVPADVEEQLEELRVDLDTARRERDEAVGRANALESELQKSRTAERETLARLASLAEAQAHAAKTAQEEGDAEVLTVRPQIVGIVERLLHERRAAKPGGRHFETDVTEAALLEEAAKKGLDKTQTFAQLRIAEASDQLRRIGNRYYLPKREAGA